jgi:hypothetical protein
MDFPMNRFWQATMNPDWYHGHGRAAPFFEGWYYKLVDPTQRHKWAIIPGVTLSGQPHSFIQILNGSTGEAFYHQYDLEAFWAATDRFEIRVGDSRFSASSLVLDVSDAGQRRHGELEFGPLTPWPVSVGSPGIMGWYAWIPFMECYHGVVSLDHPIRGSLAFDGTPIDFTRGRGYIEKDWGKSFPASWIWLQTNHFAQPGTSLTASVATIPWLGRSFRGFIIGFWHEGQLYRFATYTGARTEKLALAGRQVEWIVSDRRYRLEMTATRSREGLLKGPTTVDMGKRVAESLDASVDVRLTHLDRGRRSVRFEGTGSHAGLELFNTNAPEFLTPA